MVLGDEIQDLLEANKDDPRFNAILIEHINNAFLRISVSGSVNAGKSALAAALNGRESIFEENCFGSTNVPHSYLNKPYKAPEDEGEDSGRAPHGHDSDDEDEEDGPGLRITSALEAVGDDGYTALIKLKDPEEYLQNVVNMSLAAKQLPLKKREHLVTYLGGRLVETVMQAALGDDRAAVERLVKSTHAYKLALAAQEHRGRVRLGPMSKDALMVALQPYLGHDPADEGPSPQPGYPAVEAVHGDGPCKVESLIGCLFKDYPGLHDVSRIHQAHAEGSKREPFKLMVVDANRSRQAMELLGEALYDYLPHSHLVGKGSLIVVFTKTDLWDDGLFKEISADAQLQALSQQAAALNAEIKATKVDSRKQELRRQLKDKEKEKLIHARELGMQRLRRLVMEKKEDVAKELGLVQPLPDIPVYFPHPRRANELLKEAAQYDSEVDEEALAETGIPAMRRAIGAVAAERRAAADMQAFIELLKLVLVRYDELLQEHVVATEEDFARKTEAAVEAAEREISEVCRDILNEFTDLNDQLWHLGSSQAAGMTGKAVQKLASVVPAEEQEEGCEDEEAGEAEGRRATRRNLAAALKRMTLPAMRSCQDVEGMAELLQTKNKGKAPSGVISLLAAPLVQTMWTHVESGFRPMAARLRSLSVMRSREGSVLEVLLRATGGMVQAFNETHATLLSKKSQMEMSLSMKGGLTTICNELDLPSAFKQALCNLRNSAILSPLQHHLAQAFAAAAAKVGSNNKGSFIKAVVKKLREDGSCEQLVKQVKDHLEEQCRTSLHAWLQETLLGPSEVGAAGSAGAGGPAAAGEGSSCFVGEMCALLRERRWLLAPHGKVSPRPSEEIHELRKFAEDLARVYRQCIEPHLQEGEGRKPRKSRRRQTRQSAASDGAGAGPSTSTGAGAGGGAVGEQQPAVRSLMRRMVEERLEELEGAVQGVRDLLELGRVSLAAGRQESGPLGSRSSGAPGASAPPQQQQHQQQAQQQEAQQQQPEGAEEVEQAQQQEAARPGKRPEPVMTRARAKRVAEAAALDEDVEEEAPRCPKRCRVRAYKPRGSSG